MHFGRLPFCALLILSSAATSQTVTPSPFRSVESRNGAHVTIRHGDRQSVRILEGAPKVFVAAGAKLIIDNHGQPHRSRARIEIVTPNLEGLSVQEGGRLAIESGFPRQGTIAAAVANGGSLDLRRLPVDQVAASVSQGGRIAARPARQLAASVSHGGAIIYWGEPAVTSAVRDGGVVQRGKAEDADRPL